MRWHLAVFITVSLSVSGCARSQRVVLLDATDLRHEIVKPSNVHVVRLDVQMSRRDWELVREKDTLLEVDNCQHPERRTMSSPVGVSEISRPDFYDGRPTYRVTFNMFSTNVPEEIPKAMRNMTCVRLIAGAGYGWKSYFSDPIYITVR